MYHTIASCENGFIIFDYDNPRFWNEDNVFGNIFSHKGKNTLKNGIIGELIYSHSKSLKYELMMNTMNSNIFI